jgi:hypothetical protein
MIARAAGTDDASRSLAFGRLLLARMRSWLALLV